MKRLDETTLRLGIVQLLFFPLHSCVLLTRVWKQQRLSNVTNIFNHNYLLSARTSFCKHLATWFGHIGCAKVEVVASIVPTKGQNRKDNLGFFRIDLILIGRTKWTFVRFPTCPRSRNEKSWNSPGKWFHDDFRLVNLFLSIPGSWEPVYGNETIPAYHFATNGYRFETRHNYSQWHREEKGDLLQSMDFP